MDIIEAAQKAHNCYPSDSCEGCPLNIRTMAGNNVCNLLQEVDWVLQHPRPTKVPV